MGAQLLNLIKLVLRALDIYDIELASLCAVQQRLLVAILLLINFVLAERIKVLCGLQMIQLSNATSGRLKVTQLIVETASPTVVIGTVPLHDRSIVSSHEQVDARLILTDACRHAATTHGPAAFQRESKRTFLAAKHSTAQVVRKAAFGTGSEATAAHVVARLIALSCEPALNSSQVLLQLARLGRFQKLLFGLLRGRAQLRHERPEYGLIDRLLGASQLRATLCT